MGRPRNAVPSNPKPFRGSMRLWWNGRWHHLGKESQPQIWKAEHARLLALWASDPNAAALDPSELLIEVLGRDYLASADAPRGKDHRTRIVTVLGLLRELHPRTAVSEFGPVEFKAWQRWVAGLPSTKDPSRTRFNATSIRDFRACVKALWKWGVANRGMPAEAWQALRAVPPPKAHEVRAASVVRPADPGDVEKVLPLLPPCVRAIVELIRLTGARPTEILTLRPADVDQAGDVWIYDPSKHKGTWRGKGRSVYLNLAAQAVLSPWLVGCPPESFVFTPAKSERMRTAARGEHRRTPRYPSHMRRNESKRKGKVGLERYTHRSLGLALRRACKRAGVRFTPYSLRHLLGSEIRKSHGLEAVRAILGHSYKSMSDLYSKAADREIAEKVVRGG